MVSQPSDTRAPSDTDWPGSEYLSALSSRFASTCRIMGSSVVTTVAPSGTLASTTCPCVRVAAASKSPANAAASA